MASRHPRGEMCTQTSSIGHTRVEPGGGVGFMPGGGGKSHAPPVEGLYPSRSLAIRAHLGSAGEGDGYHGAPSAGVVWQASLMFPASCSPRSCVRAPGRVWVWSCGPVSEAIGSVWLKWIGFVPFLVGVMAIPISMGIAILRYRLYEIDTLINRTLVYGLLTVTLVGL